VGTGPVIVVVIFFEVIEVISFVGVVELIEVIVLLGHGCLTSARQAFRRPGCTAVTRCVTGAQPPSP
jgi:hypothetical protein